MAHAKNIDLKTALHNAIEDNAALLAENQKLSRQLFFCQGIGFLAIAAVLVDLLAHLAAALIAYLM